MPSLRIQIELPTSRSLITSLLFPCGTDDEKLAFAETRVDGEGVVCGPLSTLTIMCASSLPTSLSHLMLTSCVPFILEKTGELGIADQIASGAQDNGDH